MFSEFSERLRTDETRSLNRSEYTLLNNNIVNTPIVSVYKTEPANGLSERNGAQRVTSEIPISNTPVLLCYSKTFCFLVTDGGVFPPPSLVISRLGPGLFCGSTDRGRRRTFGRDRRPNRRDQIKGPSHGKEIAEPSVAAVLGYKIENIDYRALITLFCCYSFVFVHIVTE